MTFWAQKYRIYSIKRQQPRINAHKRHKKSKDFVLRTITDRSAFMETASKCLCFRRDKNDVLGTKIPYLFD